MFTQDALYIMHHALVDKVVYSCAAGNIWFPFQQKQLQRIIFLYCLWTRLRHFYWWECYVFIFYDYAELLVVREQEPFCTCYKNVLKICIGYITWYVKSDRDTFISFLIITFSFFWFSSYLNKEILCKKL